MSPAMTFYLILSVIVTAGTGLAKLNSPDVITICSNQARLYADAGNCHKFIRCVNGKPVSFTCPPKTAFNPDTQICGWLVGDNECIVLNEPQPTVNWGQGFSNSNKANVNRQKSRESSLSSYSRQESDPVTPRPVLQQSRLVSTISRRTTARPRTFNQNMRRRDEVKPTSTFNKFNQVQPSGEGRPSTTTSSRTSHRPSAVSSQYNHQWHNTMATQTPMSQDLKKVENAPAQRERINTFPNNQTTRLDKPAQTDRTITVSDNKTTRLDTPAQADRVITASDNKITSEDVSTQRNGSSTQADIHTITQTPDNKSVINDSKISSFDVTSPVTVQEKEEEVIAEQSTPFLPTTKTSDVTLTPVTTAGATQSLHTEQPKIWDVTVTNSSESLTLEQNISTVNVTENSQQFYEENENNTKDKIIIEDEKVYQFLEANISEGTTTSQKATSDHTENESRNTTIRPNDRIDLTNLDDVLQTIFEEVLDTPDSTMPSKVADNDTIPDLPKDFPDNKMLNLNPSSESVPHQNPTPYGNYSPKPYMAALSLKSETIVQVGDNDKSSQSSKEATSTSNSEFSVVGPASVNVAEQVKSQRHDNSNIIYSPTSVQSTQSPESVQSTHHVIKITHLKQSPDETEFRLEYQDRSFRSSLASGNNNVTVHFDKVADPVDNSVNNNTSSTTASPVSSETPTAVRSVISENSTTASPAPVASLTNTTKVELVAAAAVTFVTPEPVLSTPSATTTSSFAKEKYNVGFLSAPYMVRGLVRHFRCPRPEGHFPDPNNCSIYYHCSGDVAYRRDCPTGQVFHQGVLACVSSALAPPCPHTYMDTVEPERAFANSICLEPNGLSKDKDSCTHYYECTNGWPIRRKCIVGTVFDESLGKCSWSNFVPDCEATKDIRNSNAETFRTYTFQCPHDGYFRDPQQCNVYYLCANGESVKILCDPGTSFDATLNMCVWNRLVPDCDDNGFIISRGWEGQKNLDKISSLRGNEEKHQHKLLDSVPFTCPEAHGLYPDPANCSLFVHCFKKKAYRHQCQPGTVFSSDTAACTWRHLVPECQNEAGLRRLGKESFKSNAMSKLQPTIKTKLSKNSVAQRQEESALLSAAYQSKVSHYDTPHVSPQLLGIQDFECPAVLDGFYRDNMFCDIFHRCVLGQRFTFTCPTGTFFRLDGNLCDFWETVTDCTQDGVRVEALGSLPEVAPLPEPVSVVQPAPNEYDVSVVAIDADPIPCPAASGLFTHPRNCHQFLFCAHYVPLVLTCPDSLLYNSQTLTCDFAKKVQCLRYDYVKK